MPNIKETYDVIVVGAGHAGCEAALASARLGLETIIFTVSVESIAMMPGMFMFLGVNGGRGGAPLHSSKFDFDEEVLLVGAEAFKRILES